MFQIIRCLLLIMLACPVRSAAAQNTDGPGLEVRLERAGHYYHPGDTAVFSVEIVNPGRVPGPLLLHYRFSEDGARLLDKGSLEIVGPAIKLRSSLDRPGFLRLDVILTAGADTVRRASACGFDPEGIRPTNVAPGDFTRFWRQGIAELTRVPVDPRLEPVTEEKIPGAKRCLVSLANIEGSRMFGWLTVPEGKGPFPALVYVMGAPGGIREFRTDPRSAYAEAGMIVLAVNIHGIELGRDPQFYERLHARHILGSFPFQGCDDPYRYYYRRVVLGGIRALDYLCGREDVDTTRLAVAGASQGGGLSLLITALDRRVKAVAVNVPAMCDHTGVLYGRPTGWPHLLEREKSEQAGRTSAYFDGAVAAGFIEVPALLTVSLLDEACPPTTVYSAYNNLKGTKRIVPFPGKDHPQSFGPERTQLMIQWLLETLNRGPTPRKTGSRPPGQTSISGKRVPVIYCTDLFHPHDDPDDHFDIATLYAMPELDLKAIILDQGAKQHERPGSIPVSQLNTLTGRNVPLAVGLSQKLSGPKDKGLEQGAEFQRAVELILTVLKESPTPVNIVTVGSVRDVAAAFNREPDLFRAKAARIMMFIGEASTDYMEYNVTLDPHAYVCLMRSGLPIYWVPCFDGRVAEGIMTNNGHASYWIAKHENLLKDCQPEVLQFFIYALEKESAPPAEFLTLSPDPEAKARLMAGKRNLWCTAVFTSLADRKIVRDGERYLSVGSDTGTVYKEHKIFEFSPVYVSISEDAKIAYGETGKAQKIMRFKVLDQQSYAEAMTSVTAHLLSTLRAVKR